MKFRKHGASCYLSPSVDYYLTKTHCKLTWSYNYLSALLDQRGLGHADGPGGVGHLEPVVYVSAGIGRISEVHNHLRKMAGRARTAKMGAIV